MPTEQQGALRDAGLEFVLAPLPDDTGAPTRRLGEHFAVSVDAVRRGGLQLIRQLRARRTSGGERRRSSPASTPVASSYRPGSRAGTISPFPAQSSSRGRARKPSLPWRTGPFAEPARALLAARATRFSARCEPTSERAERLRQRSDGWVVTHGEPHRANLIVDTEGGSPYLVDWDTALVAPRERDLWHGPRRGADGLGRVRRDRRRRRARHRGARALPAGLGLSPTSQLSSPTSAGRTQKTRTPPRRSGTCLPRLPQLRVWLKSP